MTVRSRFVASLFVLLLAALGHTLTAHAQHPTAVTSIVNANEDTTLETNYSGGLLAPGKFADLSNYSAPNDSIPAEGAGVRMMWYPAKAAVRGGRVGRSKDGTQWDADRVGKYSAAFGVDTKASGFATTAMGNQTSATASHATAMGSGTTAKGFAATAMGQITTASGNSATAMGRKTTASGSYATAMGESTTASGGSATAMGESTTASSLQAMAMGLETTASGLRATAMGFETTASGASATAMGLETEAANGQSLSLGICNDANRSADGTLLAIGNGSYDATNDNCSSTDDAFTVDDQGIATASSHDTFSDRRLKTAIEPLRENALTKLAALQPVRYEFKDERAHPAGEQLGLVAQDVQKEFPSLVREGAEGMLSLAYPKLTAVLLKGLQEQQTTIETQRAQLDSLTRRVERLAEVEREVATLRTEVQRASSATAGWTGPLSRLLLAVLFGGLLGVGFLHLHRQ